MIDEPRMATMPPMTQQPFRLVPYQPPRPPLQMPRQMSQQMPQQMPPQMLAPRPMPFGAPMQQMPRPMGPLPPGPLGPGQMQRPGPGQYNPNLVRPPGAQNTARPNLPQNQMTPDQLQAARAAKYAALAPDSHIVYFTVDGLPEKATTPYKHSNMWWVKGVVFALILTGSIVAVIIWALRPPDSTSTAQPTTDKPFPVAAIAVLGGLGFLLILFALSVLIFGWSATKRAIQKVVGGVTSVFYKSHSEEGKGNSSSGEKDRLRKLAEEARKRAAEATAKAAKAAAKAAAEAAQKAAAKAAKAAAEAAAKAAKAAAEAAAKAKRAATRKAARELKAAKQIQEIWRNIRQHRLQKAAQDIKDIVDAAKLITTARITGVRHILFGEKVSMSFANNTAKQEYIPLTKYDANGTKTILIHESSALGNKLKNSIDLQTLNNISQDLVTRTPIFPHLTNDQILNQQVGSTTVRNILKRGFVAQQFPPGTHTNQSDFEKMMLLLANVDAIEAKKKNSTAAKPLSDNSWIPNLNAVLQSSINKYTIESTREQEALKKSLNIKDLFGARTGATLLASHTTNLETLKKKLTEEINRAVTESAKNKTLLQKKQNKVPFLNTNVWEALKNDLKKVVTSVENDLVKRLEASKTDGSQIVAAEELDPLAEMIKIFESFAEFDHQKLGKDELIGNPRTRDFFRLEKE